MTGATVADVTATWTTLLTNQLPFAVLLVLIGLAGVRKVWRFGHQYDEAMAEKDRQYAAMAAAKDQRIAEVRADATAHLAALSAGYEARLKEKDEECERERVRGDRLEAYTDRLIDAAMEATVLATRAVNTKER